MPEPRRDAADVPVVILCGGFGTRLAEKTETIPKPMVEIGGRPVLWHIMKHYAVHGHREFVLALGYKGDQIKRFFLDFYALNQDLTVELHEGRVETVGGNGVEPWRVHLVDTGLSTATGGRLRVLAPRLRGRPFMLTYGDGVSDVDLGALWQEHRHRKAAVTLTAVRPPARFGVLELDAHGFVRHFKEKERLSEGWISGGFFVVEAEALADIGGDDVMWEHEPLERLASRGQLCAYQHDGFWQCIDTLRDLRHLQELWAAGAPPWKTWM